MIIDNRVIYSFLFVDNCAWRARNSQCENSKIQYSQIFTKSSQEVTTPSTTTTAEPETTTTKKIEGAR